MILFEPPKCANCKFLVYVPTTVNETKTWVTLSGTLKVAEWLWINAPNILLKWLTQ